MGHALVRAQGDIVTRLDILALGQAYGMLLDNLLCQGLGDCRCRLQGIEEGGGRGILKLAVEALDFGVGASRLGDAAGCRGKTCATCESNRLGPMSGSGSL